MNLKKIIVFCCTFFLTLVIIGNYPVLAADSVNGAKIFNIQCAGCHLNGGNIIRRNKTLKLKALQRNNVDSLDKIIALVNNGKGNMSAFKERLTSQEIENVATYILEQAANNWR
jgi:cytochrome c6